MTKQFSNDTVGESQCWTLTFGGDFYNKAQNPLIINTKKDTYYIKIKNTYSPKDAIKEGEIRHRTEKEI